MLRSLSRRIERLEARTAPEASPLEIRILFVGANRQVVSSLLLCEDHEPQWTDGPERESPPQIATDNEKDSIGSAHAGGRAGTPERVGVSTADRIH